MKLPRWTPEQDARLLQLVREHGSMRGEECWSDVAEQLACGRSASAVEQHYQKKLSRTHAAAMDGEVAPGPEPLD